MSKSKSKLLGGVSVALKVTLALAALGTPVACGRVAPGGTDSSTHWLGSCDTDADCGEQSCVCGTCFKPCVETSDCGGLVGGTCASAPECPTSALVDVCAVTCNTDDDCAPLGEGLVCQAGVCWAESADRPGDQCDCQDPACAERIGFVCGGLDHCPPTLDDALAYDRWPHEPSTQSDTTYTVCDGGVATFAVSHWEAPYSLMFAPDGLLLTLSNSIQSASCGPMGGIGSHVDCRTCYVTRAGGLKHAGEPGEPGEPARHESGYYFCELDADDRLVMPAGIPTNQELWCNPMDVAPGTPACMDAVSARFYWNGRSCVRLDCEACTGTDCSRLYTDAVSCEADHSTCDAGPDSAACAELACTDADILGTWQFAEACADEYLIQLTLPEACERTLTRETYQGTLTFAADGTSTRDYYVFTAQSWHESAECLAAIGSEEVPSEAYCSQSRGDWSCSFDGTECYCEGVLDPRHVSDTVTYDRSRFCVADDRLSFVELRSVAEFDPGSYPVTLHLVR